MCLSLVQNISVQIPKYIFSKMPSVLVLIAKYICPFNINLFLLLNKFVLSKFICQNFKTYLSKFEKYICANCYGMVKIANNTNFLKIYV